MGRTQLRTWSRPIGGAMPSGLRYRFWLESILGSITGVVAVVTVFWHDWIEAVLGVDPDKGNGSAEWLVVLILLILTVALAVGARLEWHRTQLAGR
jgi:DMSO/TMAO reductase YedYZ heme-binding membrane subunit